MPPILPPLAQSESKKRFFERLGLREDDPDHKRIYALMKEEAVKGRSRMVSSPEALIPALRNDPTVEPPYSNSQLNETATHQEILRIYDLARPETRAYYNLGRDTDHFSEENWVIRWMLWHVNRYRDSRNKNRTRSSSVAPSGPGPDRRSMSVSTTAGTSADDDNINRRQPPTQHPPAERTESDQRSRYWDPVRDA